jgi:hypothetical protein
MDCGIGRDELFTSLSNEIMSCLGRQGNLRADYGIALQMNRGKVQPRQTEQPL